MWYRYKGLESFMDNLNKQRIANLLVTVDLMEFSITLMRQNIARRLPNAKNAIIERELKRWLIEQPQDFIASSDLEDASS